MIILNCLNLKMLIVVLIIIIVPKKIFSTSEEEPDVPPSKFPHTEPIGLKIVSSFENLPTTTEDSASVDNVKHSSSERTSSLIASTYRETNKFFKKY